MLVSPVGLVSAPGAPLSVASPVEAAVGSSPVGVAADDVDADVFLAVAFEVVAFFAAAVFVAGAFFAAVFLAAALVPGAFFAGAFLAVVFFAAAVFVAGAFFAAVFLAAASVVGAGAVDAVDDGAVEPDSAPRDVAGVPVVAGAEGFAALAEVDAGVPEGVLDVGVSAWGRRACITARNTPATMTSNPNLRNNRRLTCTRVTPSRHGRGDPQVRRSAGGRGGAHSHPRQLGRASAVTRDGWWARSRP